MNSLRGNWNASNANYRWLGAGLIIGSAVLVAASLLILVWRIGGSAASELSRSHTSAPVSSPKVTALTPAPSLTTPSRQDASAALSLQLPLVPMPPASPQVEGWLGALATSYRPQDLLFKAIAGHGDSDRKELYLLLAFAHQPDDLLVSFHLLSHCVERPDSGVCVLPFEQVLVQHDGQNVYTLMHLALYRAALGDHQAAEKLLLQSAWGEVEQDYFLRHLEALDESYRYHGVARTLGTIQEGLALANAATVADYRQLLALCDTLVAGSGADGLSLCHHMGKRLQGRGRSLLDQATGGLVQLRYSADHGGQAEADIQLLQQQVRHHHEVLEALHGLLQEHTEHSISDAIWEHFLRLYQTRDEVVASHYLVAYITGSISQLAAGD